MADPAATSYVPTAGSIDSGGSALTASRVVYSSDGDSLASTVLTYAATTLTGPSGGYKFIGGSGSADPLDLVGTSHATPGLVRVLVDSTSTNTVVNGFAVVRSVSGGSGAAGVGVGSPAVYLENAGGTSTLAAVGRYSFSTATAGAEVSRYGLSLLNTSLPAAGSEQHVWTPTQYIGPAGTAAAPSLCVGGFSNDGFYNDQGGAGNILVSVAGTRVAWFTTSRLLFTSYNLDMGTNTIHGGSASGGNLLLSSTSHATKGNVVIGDTSTLVFDQANKRIGVGVTPSTGLHVTDTGSSSPRGILNGQHSGDVNGAFLHFRKSAGTAASPETVADTYRIGVMLFEPHDGTTYLASGQIYALVAGSVSTGSVPTDIGIFTGTAGGAGGATGLLVKSTGSVQLCRGGTTAVDRTDNWLYVPTSAGTPTGVPTAVTGLAAICVDTTNNKLYFYSGGAWRDAGP